MSSFRNIILICILSFFIIFGFSALTEPRIAVNTVPPATMTDDAVTAPAVVNLHAAPAQSSFAVLLGIVGLVYLKIIWKLIHSPDILNDEKGPPKE